MATTTQGDESALTQDRVIARLLIAEIVEWRIPPGSWIREREIAARFGVSHAPVREAFRHVASIGLIKVVPWRGAFVTEIDHHTATEVYELWKAIFGVICRLACTEMSDRDGRELMHRLVEYKDVAQRTSNPFEHVAVSTRIGWFIAKRSRAPMAMELLDRVALLARWQLNVFTDEFVSAHSSEGAGLHSAVLFEQLCRHIVAREPDDADRLARELVATSQHYFAEALDEYRAKQARRGSGEKARRFR